MPVSSLLNGSIVEVKAEGRYTLPELLQAITDAYHEDAAPAFPRLLIDTRASSVRQSKHDVQERLAAIDRWRSPRPAKRVALVVAPGRNHELAIFYSFYAQQRGTQTEVFLDVDQARQWLAGSDQPSPTA